MSKKLLAAGLHLTTYLSQRLTQKYYPGGNYYTSYTVTIQYQTTEYDNYYTNNLTWLVTPNPNGQYVSQNGSRFDFTSFYTYYYSYGPRSRITTRYSNTYVLTYEDPYYYNDYTYITIKKWTTW